MGRDENCIFCKIVTGEAEADNLFRDDVVVAFRDRYPVAPVHVLIVPLLHLPSLNEADDPELLGHMIASARTLAKELGIAESGYRTLFNCQSDGGQEIFHLHLHLIGGRRLGPMA